MRFDLGDGINLEHRVYDRDGALTSATVALTVTKPSGATINPVVTETATPGIYRAATFTADETDAAGDSWSYAFVVSGAVTDVATGAFNVLPAAPRTYVSVDRLKRSLDITDTDRDDLLLLAAETASRRIDGHTGRRFYADPLATTVTLVPRTYRWAGGSRVIIPDMVSLDTVSTGSGETYDAWDADTYEPVYFREGDPSTAIIGIASLGPSWRTGSAGRLRLLGRPGWPGPPAEVESAALILAGRYFRRKDSPEGVTGSAEWGGIRLSRFDPDVATLLAPFTLAAIG